MEDLYLLNVISKLSKGADRKNAAKELASLLNAEDIIIFIEDLQVNTLLPAPGFTQTLQNINSWKSFLNKCTSELCKGTVPYPHKDSNSSSIGIPIDNSIVVIIGGSPNENQINKLKAISPLITALLKEELRSISIQSMSIIANKEIQKAERLAIALTGIRKKLNVSYIDLSKKKRTAFKNQ